MVMALVGIAIFAAYWRGIYSILKGEFKPSRYTWAIWVAVDIVMISTMFATGSRHVLVLPLCYILGSGTVAIMSLKYGEKDFNFKDTVWNLVCLAGAVVSIIVWVKLGEANAPLAIILLAHLFGTILTVRKAWLRPYNEDRWTWFLFGLGDVFSLFLIQKWCWQQATFSVYDTIACFLVFFLTLRYMKSSSRVGVQ
jgi:hypothetical protein